MQLRAWTCTEIKSYTNTAVAQQFLTGYVISCTWFKGRFLVPHFYVYVYDVVEKGLSAVFVKQ